MYAPAPAWYAASPSSVPPPPSASPLDLGTPHARFMVSGPALGVSYGGTPSWYPYASLRSVSLVSELSWAYATIYAPLGVLFATHGGTGWIVFSVAIAVVGFVMTAFTRRRYRLDLRFHDGRSVSVPLGVAYPRTGVTLKTTAWLPRLAAGWQWLSWDLARHGVQIFGEAPRA